MHFKKPNLVDPSQQCSQVTAKTPQNPPKIHISYHKKHQYTLYITVQHAKQLSKTTISLLANPRTQDYNIIAVQKPWQNLNALTTLSSYQSRFHLLYRSGEDTRVCFYINTNINLSRSNIFQQICVH